MPTTKTTKTTKKDLPGTVQRSPAKAQRTFAKTLDSAHEQYDDEERAHRTAYSALKRSFEKLGDHWEPKNRYTKKDLVDRARKAGVKGFSRMTKQELGEALAREQG